MSDDHELSGQIEQYKKLVEHYELLNAEIQLLITTAKENNPDKELSPEDMKRYREIARERDEAFSEMRALQRLLMDDTSGEFTATEEE